MAALTLLTFANVATAIAVASLTRYAFYLMDAFLRSPIAVIPGAALDVAFPPWGWWNLMTGRGYECKFKRHERFGGVVRIDSKTVSVADPSLAQRLLRVDDISKARFYDDIKIDPKDPGELLTMRNKEDHRKIRHAISPAFSIRFLADLEVQMDQVWKVLESKLTNEAQAGQGYADADVVELFAAVALDIISSTAFGESLDVIRLGGHPYRTAADLQAVITAFQSITPFNVYSISWCRDNLAVLWNHLATLRRRRQAALDNGEKVRRDILYIMMELEAKGVIQPVELRENSLLFMGAGSETSASTMAWATHFLLCHPESLTRLRSELSNATLSSSQSGFLRLADLKPLPYLNAVIKETLRCRPVATRLMREMDKDTTVSTGGWDGVERAYHIPRGTNVEISIYALHRSPKLWQRASEFWPERWLGTETVDEEAWGVDGVINQHETKNVERKPAKVNLDAFIPFSAGTRDCIGKNFGMNEIRLFLGRLVHLFDIEPLYDVSKPVTGSDYITLQPPPFPVKITPRKALTAAVARAM
ncbi:cytochrome P450 [Gonapodya prolifera JEL478]|uniref:Cytochrome P450 n=1 Tax=Gonapodya prolifera (strain JEL478) TaxID=1344416 RepID=A0A139AAT3_GONPJ|nr:cytochrome P450 [Gonapodya prolifera JEL478]|eukprot:KXS13759.1 cytochrome P450 [Gonapodya prolifera JEL478]